MSEFKFKLEAALRLRHMRVDRENARLRDLLAQRAGLQKSLLAAREECAEACAYIHENRNVQSADLRALSSFALGVEARAKTLSVALSALQTQITEQEHTLRQAEKDQRLLAKLRAKRLAEWSLAADRAIEASSQELWLLSHTTNKENPKCQ